MGVREPFLQEESINTQGLHLTKIRIRDSMATQFVAVVALLGKSLAR